MTDHPLRITVEFYAGPLDGHVGVVHDETTFAVLGDQIHIYELGERYENGRAEPIMRHARVLALTRPG
jgi:hypothetical protein